MSNIRIHPSELSYLFSFSKTEAVVGWGAAPFQPESKADLPTWNGAGAKRLLDAGRLIPREDGSGSDVTPVITAAVLALANPSLVLLAERKEGDGLRRLTIHRGEDGIWGMTRMPDGMFEMVLYADLTAAAVAACGFLGAALSPTEAGTRVEAAPETFAAINDLAKAGNTDDAATQLAALGVTPDEAATVVEAMTTPAAAGRLGVLYCGGNRVRSAVAYSVMTTAAGQTWVLYPPASLRSPMMLEHSSVPALAGRIVINGAARTKIAA